MTAVQARVARPRPKVGRVARPSTLPAQQRPADADRRPGVVVCRAQPQQGLARREPGEPLHDGEGDADAEQRADDHPDPRGGPAAGRGTSAQAIATARLRRAPGHHPVDGEGVEAPVEARPPGWRRDRGRVGDAGSVIGGGLGGQGLVTWMVTPSPRSMIAPGISWTAMPGCRSSGGEAGLDQDRPVGRAEVGDDGGAVVGARARTHLQVGRGDLLVGARHGDQPAAARRAEAAGLRCPADEHGAGRPRRSPRSRGPAGPPVARSRSGRAAVLGSPGGRAESSAS